jgi:hypothetical protein
VVQQKQGRVVPTMQMKEMSVNDDPVLEAEADVMGVKSWDYNGAITETVQRHSIPVVQRNEISAKKKVIGMMDQLTGYNVDFSKDNALMNLLVQMWNAFDPRFEGLFLELVAGLSSFQAPPSDAYIPPTLYEVYESLAEGIGEELAIKQFAKHHILFFRAADFLNLYEPSRDVSIPFYKEKYDAGTLPGREIPPGIAMLALIPTHPGGKGVKGIVDTYAAGFDGDEALFRFGLSVGVNSFAGIGNAESGKLGVETMLNGLGVPGFPFSVIGFTWKRGWLSKQHGPVEEHYMLNLIAAMPASERNLLVAEERTPIPHGYLREIILKATTTATAKATLKSRPFVTDVYYHIADDDSPSVKALDGSGIYNVYKNEVGKWKEEKGKAPSMLAGGYRVRREDNERDKGDIPRVEGTELSELASDFDHVLRSAIAELDPRIPYLSEANLLVNADELDNKVRTDDDRSKLTGKVFGKHSFESGNLKRFMGLNGLSEKDAKTRMGYLKNASLVTGTKGGGSRFYEYRFRKAANYSKELQLNTSSFEQLAAGAYKNALSMSQNIGSLGNLAINLSLYFDATMGLKVSTKTICTLIESLVNSSRLKPLFKSTLLDEAGYKKAKNSEMVENITPENRRIIEEVISKTLAVTLDIQQMAYDNTARLMDEYIKKYEASLAAQTTVV